MRNDRSKLIILFLFGVFYSLALAFLFQRMPSLGYNDDFLARWHASRQLFESGRSIYDWQNAVEMAEQTGWPKIYELRYYYPAYLLIFTGPLSFLPYPLARFLWTLFGLWALWFGTLIFLRLPKQVLTTNQLTTFLVAMTVAVPVFQHTLNGQFNTIGVLALGLVYWTLLRKRFLLAGIFAAGLLFKPQATLFTLAFLLFWSLWKRDRWRFLLGLGVTSLGLWLVAEWLERNWVVSFLDSLGSYSEIRPVLVSLGDTHMIFSAILWLLALWLMWHWRATHPANWIFRSMLLFTLSLNFLTFPLYAMLHAVLLGPMFALLLGIVADWKPDGFILAWRTTVTIFVVGIVLFAIVLILTGTSGLHIGVAEAIYGIAAPLFLGAVSLISLFSTKQPSIN